MSAMPPEASPEGGTSAGGLEGQRQARYNHLVGRLRARQITMEEATELFGLMQGMLRASDAARRALAGLAAPSSGAAPIAGGGPRAAPQPLSAGADDFLLMGLLAMGAGAGLLAAISRRLSEGPPAPRSERPSSPRAP